MAKSILLVEDNPDLGPALDSLLQIEGYSTATTPSGAEALSLAARSPFDFILLDVRLEELSGPAVQRVLSDLSVSAHVIVMSGGLGPWEADAFRAGATACLRKPFGADALLELLRSLAEPPPARWPKDVRQLTGEDLQAISRMSREGIDALPFGAIRLDREGRIDRFNTFESRAARLFAPSVLKLRFSEVAPCSTVKRFVEKVERGYQDRQLDEVLRFVFPRFGARAVVSIRLFYDAPRDRLWIFVSQGRGGPEGLKVEDELARIPPRYG